MRPPENPFLQVTVPVPPGPKTPDESGGNYYDRKVTEFHKDPNIWLNYSDLQYPDKRSALLLAVHNRAAASDLHAFIRVFAEATLIECARRFGPYLYRAENRDLVQSWASVLWSMDLWDRFQDFEEILKYCGLGSLAHFLSPGPWFRKQLLFSIPCPLRPEWDPRIRFLSDKLLLALTIRDYFKTTTNCRNSSRRSSAAWFSSHHRRYTHPSIRSNSGTSVNGCQGRPSTGSIASYRRWTCRIKSSSNSPQYALRQLDGQ